MLTEFTKQEKLVIGIMIAIVFCGAVFRFLFDKYPALTDIVNWIDSERIYRKLDINTATIDELVDLPYIGEYTAGNIIEYRRKNGPFTSLAQIKNVKGIRDKNYLKFRPYLKRVRR